MGEGWQGEGVPSLPPLPATDDTEAVLAWVAENLGHLTLEGPEGVRVGGHRGGQAAADVALATLDVTSYARSRSIVLPPSRRGASRLSPYIRHGLLSLPEVWDAVTDAPAPDRRRYRDELLWQEFARHLYARTEGGLAEPLRYHPPHPPAPREWSENDEMACTSWLRGELEDDGWLVNQTRMWWASHWSVRHGRDWREGEDDFFRHLLDGSRAANRLGWQWTVGTGTGKPYGFSRWQVEKRAPQLCRSCALREACPIQDWPEATRGPSVTGSPVSGPSAPGAGPDSAVLEAEPAAVWLTAESLGDGDPALAAHRDLPVVFVFDEPLLRSLRLSGKRLVFLAESLADLAARREVDVRLGSVPEELADTPLAATFAPVPGFARHSASVTVAALHPWPWLARPVDQRLTSYSAWRKGVRRS